MHIRNMEYVEWCRDWHCNRLFFIYCFLFVFNVCVVLPMCVCQCTVGMCGIPGDWKRMSDTLKLELWMVVNHHIRFSE